MSEIQRNSEVGRAPKNTYAQNTPNENWRRWPENPIADFVMSPEESLYPTEADNQNADNARTKILNFLRNVINEGKNILNIPNGT